MLVTKRSTKALLASFRMDCVGVKFTATASDEFNVRVVQIGAYLSLVVIRPICCSARLEMLGWLPTVKDIVARETFSLLVTLPKSICRVFADVGDDVL